jgi:hypothetical protein
MVKLVVFLVIFSIVVVLLVVGFFYDDIKAFDEKRRHRHHVYQVLHNYAEDYDQLLLNNVVLNLGQPGDPATTFDHILIGDKYAYLIQDFEAQGAIYGNLRDPKLFLKNFQSTVITIPNPMIENLEAILKFEKSRGIDPEEKICVSVIVVNDSLIVPAGIKTKGQVGWFLPVNELYKTLQQAEQDDVAKISHETSQKIIQNLKSQSDANKAEMKKHSRPLKSSPDAPVK